MGYKTTGQTAEVKPQSASKAYAIIPKGVYAIQVVGCSEGRYKGGYKDLNKKFDYVKLTPEFEVANDNHTKINKQDITLGAINKEGALFRPDGDLEKPALYSTAQFFLSSIGFVQDVTDEAGAVLRQEVDLEHASPSLIGGQWFMGKIEPKSYTSAGESRQKNEITGFYRMKPEEAASRGLYVVPETGMIFDSPEAADLWNELFDDIEANGDAPEPFGGDDDQDEDDDETPFGN